MARTKASVGAKVSSGKSSKARCSAAPPPSTSGPSGSGSRSHTYSGGNSVCQRETPKWQRPITNFFVGNTKSKDSDSDSGDDSASTSKPKPKRNVIQSDDEDASDKNNNQDELPTNRVLNETIELEPLTGDDSHKIEEYYPKHGVKGKGKGKKSNKENVATNGERKSAKRDLEESFEESVNVSKKVKVN